MDSCKYCKPGSVGVLFKEMDFDGTSVFIDNKPDGSILATGLVIPRRKGRVETDVCDFHPIHYCPFCGRKLD